MSMMRCEGCGFPVNTDDDPESLYVDGAPTWVCLCEQCREEMEEDEHSVETL